MSFLILSSTGTVGSGVLKGLVQRGVAVTGATRDPAKASKRTPGFSSYVTFDYDRPDTFAPALAGVSSVFMAVRPGDEHSDKTGIPFVEAMRLNGVRHVVLLSAMGTEMRDDFALRKIECAIEASGMAFTHLRPNWFMQMFATGTLRKSICDKGTIEIPAGAAKISYIDSRDIADIAVETLTNPSHRNKAYLLTGPDALGHEEIAAILGKATGRTIRYVPLDEETARQGLRKAGFPPEWEERLIIFYRLVRKGWCSSVSDIVPKLLNHVPRNFTAFAEEYSSYWKHE